MEQVAEDVRNKHDELKSRLDVKQREIADFASILPGVRERSNV
jgi:hypothetical protein